MIVLGGFPPANENPKDPYGSLLNVLNEYVIKRIEKETTDLEEIKQNFASADVDLTLMQADLTNQIESHKVLRGVRHNETAFTVGLGRKDNFRAATVAEHFDKDRDDVFVVPAGIKAVMDKEGKLDLTEYLKNESLPVNAFKQIGIMGSNQYNPKVNPRPFTGKAHLFMYGNRIMMNGVTEPGNRGTFISNAVAEDGQTVFRPAMIMGSAWKTTGWSNHVARDTTTTNIYYCFHQGFANGIARYRQNNRAGSPFFDTALFTDVITDKGYGFTTTFTNAGFTLYADAFTVNSNFSTPEWDMDGNFASSGYLTKLGGTAVKTNFNTPVTFPWSDYFTFATGITVTVSTEGSVSAAWDNEGNTILLLVETVLTLVNGVNRVNLEVKIGFRAQVDMNDKGLFRLVHLPMVSKVNIPASLVIPTNNIAKVEDITNPFHPTKVKGCFVEAGGHYAGIGCEDYIKVKFFKHSAKTLKEYILNYHLYNKAAVTETTVIDVTGFENGYLGNRITRILPYRSTAGQIGMLVRSLGSDNKQTYRALEWDRTEITDLSTTTTTDFLLPYNRMQIIKDEDIAVRTVVSESSPNGGLVQHGLGFVRENGYTGFNSLTANTPLVKGSNPVGLGDGVLSYLSGLETEFLTRARANQVARSIPNYTPKFSYQCYALRNNVMVILLTDSTCYVEVGLTTFSIVGRQVNIAFVPVGTTGIKYVNIADTIPDPSEGLRTSADVENSLFYDVSIYQKATGITTITFQRPYEELDGSVSFDLSNYNTSTIADKVIYKLATEPSAFITKGVIDTVVQINPPMMIPRKGIYQNFTHLPLYRLLSSSPPRYLSVNAARTIDSGKFTIPAGQMLMFNGRVTRTSTMLWIALAATSGYYYLELGADKAINLVYSQTRKVTANNRLEVGIWNATTGVMTINVDYVTLDNKMMSYSRVGGGIPYSIGKTTEGGSTDFFLNADKV